MKKEDQFESLQEGEAPAPQIVLAHENIDITTLTEDFEIVFVDDDLLLNQAITETLKHLTSPRVITVMSRESISLFAEMFDILLGSRGQKLEVQPLINNEADAALYSEFASTQLIIQQSLTPMAFLRRLEGAKTNEHPEDDVTTGDDTVDDPREGAELNEQD